MSEHSFLKFFSCLFTVPAIKSCGKKMPEFWKKDFITNFHVMELYVDTLGLGACSLDSANVYMRGRTLCNHNNRQGLYFLKGVILKYATTHNHSQPLATIHNYPQPPTVIHNHSQLHTTIHNYPQLPTFTTTRNHLKPPRKPSITIHNHP